MPKTRNDSESEIAGSGCRGLWRRLAFWNRLGVFRPLAERHAGVLLTGLLGASALCGNSPVRGAEITEIIDATGDGMGHSLGGPNALAIDAAGNVYVTGADSDNAFKITPDGQLTQIIDSAGDGKGHFLDFPAGIAVDALGNVYVAGHGSDNAFKITPSGVISQIIGPLGDGNSALHGATAIAVDEAGNVYLTGGISDNAFKITPKGFISSIIAGGGDGQGKTLDAPTSIALDDHGNAYVVGSVSDNVFKIGPGGTITEVIGPDRLDGPISIAVTGSGRFYVTDVVQNAVWSRGSYSFSKYSYFGSSGNSLSGAWSIFVDENEDWYVTGASSANAFVETQLEVINANGDGMGNILTFPQAIVADGQGTLYVAGTGSNNVFKISIPFGACCLPGGGCSDATLVTCATYNGGYYQGDSTTCSMTHCPEATCGNAVCESGETPCCFDCYFLHDHCSPCDCPSFAAGRSDVNASENVGFGPLATMSQSARLYCYCDEFCVFRGDCCDNACYQCGVCSYCGNGTCEWLSESCWTCPHDCGICGSCCEPLLVLDSIGDGAGNEMRGPESLVVDAAGNAYVATSSNIFKIAPDGTVQLFFKGDLFLAPKDIAVDDAGNVYVTNSINGRFVRVTAEGIAVQVLSSSAGIRSDEVALDGLGNIYVTARPSAYRVELDGSFQEIINSSGDGNGNTMDWPGAIAADSIGNVYVAGYHSHNVFKITPTGVITEIIDSVGDGKGNELENPQGLAVDELGNVYVAGESSHNVLKIMPDGTIIKIIDSMGEGNGSGLLSPRRIAVDVYGNVYVAGVLSQNAFKITPTGVITEIIDLTGNGDSLLEWPWDVAVDLVGTVYVIGQQSSNVFKITVGSCAANGLCCHNNDWPCLIGPAFKSEGDCLCSDLNGDTRVDMLDVSVLIRAFVP